MQLTRLFGTLDPNVNVIYVVPFPLSAEVLDYYTDILQICGVKDPETRF
jgi:hypothetical protein